MAFEWKVWVLFAVLRICLAREALWLNAANETVTVNGTVEQSSSEVYTLTVPVSNADQPPVSLGLGELLYLDKCFRLLFTHSIVFKCSLVSKQWNYTVP